MKNKETIKYQTKSAEVLNSADRFDNILNWILFHNEQNSRLWGVDENQWTPGDCIYANPDTIWAESDDDTDEGQYVRPMFELMEDGEFHNRNRVKAYARCEDCSVYWEGSKPCWVCGVDRPLPGLKKRISNIDDDNYLHPYLYTELDLEAVLRANSNFNQHIVDAFERMVRSFERMTISFQRVGGSLQSARSYMFSAREEGRARLERIAIVGDFNDRDRSHYCTTSFNDLSNLFNPWDRVEAGSSLIIPRDALWYSDKHIPMPSNLRDYGYYDRETLQQAIDRVNRKARIPDTLVSERRRTRRI